MMRLRGIAWRSLYLMACEFSVVSVPNDDAEVDEAALIGPVPLGRDSAEIA